MLYIILVTIYVYHFRELYNYYKNRNYYLIGVISLLTIMSIYLSIGQLLNWPIPPFSNQIKNILSPIENYIFGPN